MLVELADTLDQSGVRLVMARDVGQVRDVLGGEAAADVIPVYRLRPSRGGGNEEVRQCWGARVCDAPAPSSATSATSEGVTYPRMPALRSSSSANERRRRDRHGEEDPEEAGERAASNDGEGG